MKNQDSFLKNTKFGLDKNVITTFLVIVVVSIAILGFRISRKKICTPFGISSASVSAGKTTVFFVGDPVVFVATSPSAQEITWDFGDHTPLQLGNNAKHIYTRNGNYTISATVDNECVETIQIRIKPLAPVNPQTPVIALDSISGPEAPFANTPSTYTSPVKASKYEWNILNSPSYPTQESETATFNFMFAGNLILELKLDGDPSKVIRKPITVLPAKVAPNVVPPPINNNSKLPPPIVIGPIKPRTDTVATAQPPTEVKKEKLIIADDEFRMKFEAVQRGEITESAFDEFLCDGAQTKVLIENKGKEWQTVASICRFLSKNNDIKKIFDVSTDRDDKKCVTLIHLKYNLKSWLRRNIHI